MPGFRAKLLTLAAPTMCIGLLGAATYLQQDWPKRADADPYHRRAAAAVAAIPTQMGAWSGRERPPQKAALDILKPNAIRNIEFFDPRVDALIARPDNRISLSIVQCRSFNDMLGHYPRNCYPAYGDTLMGERPRVWTVPVVANTPGLLSADPVTASAASGERELTIRGVEYRFERLIDGRTYRRIVYNFMVVPKRGILTDMQALIRAAEDYEWRYYGAAQFQVVFDSLAGQEPSEADRDATFATLMRSCAAAIDVLESGEGTEPLAASPSPASAVTAGR